jgi:hypothetical protein
VTKLLLLSGARLWQQIFAEPLREASPINNTECNKKRVYIFSSGPGSSVGIRLATGWTVRGSNPGGGEIFRTRPDRPWGPLTSCIMGTGSFPGVKRPGRGADHPPPSSAGVKKE